MEEEDSPPTPLPSRAIQAPVQPTPANAHVTNHHYTSKLSHNPVSPSGSVLVMLQLHMVGNNERVCIMEDDTALPCDSESYVRIRASMSINAPKSIPVSLWIRGINKALAWLTD